MWNKQLFEVWGLTIKRKGSFSPFFEVILLLLMSFKHQKLNDAQVTVIGSEDLLLI